MAALSGGVAITAGQQYTQVGSQVLATGADGTAHSMASAAKATGGDARMQALAAASVALNGYSTANELAALAKDPSKATSVGVSVSIGASKSQSTESASSNTAAGSTVKALGNVSIIATGAGKDSNLRIQGSEISAGPSTGTTTLQADNAVQLLAAQNTSAQHSSQSGNSASIGLSVGGATGVTLSGSKSKGQGDGQDSTYTNTHVSAGNTASMTSGGDTTLAGATIAAKRVTTDIGGNLAITSLQDQSQYAAQSKSLGGSITIGPGFIPTGGGLSAGKTKVDSSYQSVQEQSGIQAGDGGFTVTSQGNTTLTGGAITSTQAAVDAGKNSFTTGGTLATSDLQNTASYNASGYSVSASVGTDAKGKTTPGGSAGFGKDAGDAASITTAGISGIAADKTLRTGDKQTGVGQIFDKDKVTTEVNAQIAITAEFGKQASKTVGDYAGNKAAELRQQGNEEEAKKWDEGGVYRVAAHTAIGGLTGGVNGALGATASASAAPLLNDLQDSLQTQLQQAGLGDTAAKAITQIAGTATATLAGAAVGGAAGVATAFNGDLNNRQLHPSEIKWIADNRKAFANKLSQELGRPVSDLEAMQWLTAAGESDVDADKQRSNGQFVRGTSSTQEAQAYDAAKAFIAGNTKTNSGFTDERGQSQSLFSTTNGEFTKPEVYSEWKNNASYRDYYWTVMGVNLKGDNMNVQEQATYNQRQVVANEQAAKQLLALGAQAAAGKVASGVAARTGQTQEVMPAVAKPTAAEQKLINAARIESSLGRDGENYLPATWERLKTQADQVRASTPDMVDASGKPLGNAATAEINMYGQASTTVQAHSRIGNDASSARDGFVGLPPESQRILQPENRPNSPIDRSADTEFKILENFAQQNIDNRNVQGNINLFTERPPCDSCTDVIRGQFAELFPNMEVRVFHNNGQITVYNGNAATTVVVPSKNTQKWPASPDLENPAKTSKK